MAPQLADDVEHHVLPFWAQTVDAAYGGYIVERAVTAASAGHTKQLVTQARLLWSFSRAHRAGIGRVQATHLAAARAGYRFLASRFHDATHGGYYWMTDRAGQPIDTRKVLYGQAFVIFALVEYYRASGETAALDDARRLFAVLDRRARDHVHGGWLEHFTSDWRPILGPPRYLLVEFAGLKSANTHLHLMEALAELADVVPSPAVVAALRDTLAINARVFFPSPARTVTHTSPDWSPPPFAWTRSDVAERARQLAFGAPRVSYGHNVEFAWMARRAEVVLGMAPDWTRFDVFMEHALEHGFDRMRGGLYEAGYGSRPAWFIGKLWWAQAELLTALTIADGRQPRPAYADALGLHARWVSAAEPDPQTRVWRWSLAEDGRPTDPRLAHDWKTAYHDLRATLAFLEHCGQLRLSALQGSR